jgi:hypothetical protein
MVRRVVLAVLVSAVAALVAVSPARGEGTLYVVTGTGDSGGSCGAFPNFPGAFACSTLRAAVAAADANPGSDVVVLQGIGRYELRQGAINLANDVTIVGQNARGTTIQGNGNDRLFTVAAGVNVTLSGVTLSGGASSGDGGAVLNAGSLSMIFTRVTGSRAANGGGLANSGTLSLSDSLVDRNTATAAGGAVSSSGDLFIGDTTIFANQAGSAGAISAPSSTGATLSQVTIAGNTSGATPGGVSLGSDWTAGGVLFARNLGDGVLSNCATPTSSGSFGSIEDGASCGFSGSGAANLGLATSLSDRGGQTDVLTIPSTSAAKRFASPCVSGSDQRLAPRSAGGTCDAGAFEEGAAAPPVRGFQFPVPPPEPEFHKDVVVKPVSGRVRVKLPGTDQFVDLASAQDVPLGSTIDVKAGKLQLSSVPKKNGRAQNAKFFQGVFKVTQPGRITELRLSEALAPCKKGRAASAAAKKKPKTRRLWGDGKGAFRTRGQYSAATVRGTKWLVQDSCAGTLTRVTKGVVTVRDNVRHKTIVVRAGHRYLAKPRR